MTTLDHMLPSTEAARPAVAVRAVRLAANLYKAWKNRRQIQRLGEMTEFELHDIGLTRADLHIAWRMPFGVDPTARLGAIADARALREEAARRIC